MSSFAFPRIPGAIRALVLALAGSLMLLPGARALVEPGEVLVAEMNCAACHEAAPEIKQRLDSRQSPRLGADGLRLVPRYLQTFLEAPAQTKPGTLMPDMLHEFSAEKKREVAEALTHYLVSLETAGTPAQPGASSAATELGRRLYHAVGCVQCHAPEEAPAGTANSAETREALEQLAKTSVPLGDLARKYTVTELTAFLRDPLKTRPSGRMPSLKLDAMEARAIAMYLLRAQVPASGTGKVGGVAYEYFQESLPELPEFDRLKPKTTGFADTFSLQMAERKNDFGLRFRGLLSVPKEGSYRFWTRSDDGSRLFIDGAKVVENGGIHPAQDREGKVKLTAGDHVIEAVYFDGGGQTEFKVEWQPPGGMREEIPAAVLGHEGKPMLPLDAEPFTVDSRKATAGGNYFVALQCNRCHGNLPNGTLPVDVTVPTAKPLAKLVARQPAGCLATKTGPGVPKFELTDRQRVVLLAMLQNQGLLATPLEPAEVVKRGMAVLNCYACHQRDHRGGIEGLRREFLTTVGEVDLGDEGRVPPHLNAVGAKLRPEWMELVLAEGAAVRPYMATRMPAYGSANIRPLVRAFEEADARPEAQAQPDVFAPGVAADANKFGRKLIGVGGLTCIACHNFAGNKSLGVPALDLATVGQRLKWDWFRRYLYDPQSLRPGTRMPAFWPEGKAVNHDLLGGDSEKQIASIWAFLARKNFTDLPAGLVQGKQEIVAGEEAVIYRNFIEGGGARAIGVGYPEKANLAFDANDQTLALLWQGSFIDAAKHRTGRGAGYEKPLGSNVIKGPPGPPFAVLESATTAWPKEAGKNAGYQFHGYRLDAKRRPIFRYTFPAPISAGSVAEVEVEDYPIAVPGVVDAKFQRTLTLHSARGIDQLYYRAAVGDKIDEKDGGFLIGERLHLNFEGAQAFVRQVAGKVELLVPVRFADGAATLREEITW